jgi:sugar phosphate isomerase/epimerase
MRNQISRREFLQASSVSAVTGAVAFSAGRAQAPTRNPFRGTFCLFSKPVPQLNWRELARDARQAGFGGIDLTVRPGGHVLPERAETDLPRAVAAIREEGLEVPMITTELLSIDDPTARPIFSTASKLSIQYLKPGYYHYQFINVLKELAAAGRKFRGLVDLAAQHSIQVGYHNDDGFIGSPIWDMARVLEPLDPRWCGFYFDLGHSTESGGESGWKIAGNLARPRLKMLGARDVTWEQTGPHRWRTVGCPMGQGLVHWKEFLHTLAQVGFHGPVSLHQEYTIPGVTDDEGVALSRDKVPQVMSALKRNLDYLKSVFREAYGAG